MGMARPLVLSVSGSARRLVEEAGAGVFVPPEDTVALANTLKDLVGRPDLLLKMGAAGRDYVLRKFDRLMLADEYLEILERVVARKKRM